MRILFISSLFPPRVTGGAEQSAASLAKGLTERGHTTKVFTLCPSKLEKYEYAVGEVNVCAYPLQNTYWPYHTDSEDHQTHSKRQKLLWHIKDSSNAKMVQTMRQDILDFAPDVVLTHNLQGFSTAIWPAVKAMGIPIVHTTHDFALLCPRTVMYKNGVNCANQTQRCLDCRLLTRPRLEHAKSINAVVGVSKKIIQIYQEHGVFTKTPVKTIYNALPSDTPTAVERHRSRSATTQFGFLGRVSQAKGFETLLEAMAMLASENVRLIVGGRVDPAYLEQLQHRYDLSRVEFLGYCKPETLFAQIDVFVFPSASLEALGNSVFEAYSHGIPVIGSDQGGIPEMIVAATTGYVFPAQNALALRAHMQKFIDNQNLAATMRAACLEKTSAFLPSRRITEYETWILEAVESHRCK